MKRFLVFSFVVLTAFTQLFGGNPERAGQAGATQLLINTWGRSSGFNGINIGSTYGIESIMNNPAGLATTKRTELVFGHTRYLVGTDININSFGFSQSMKKAGVIGIYVSAFDLGDFIRTTEDNPEGELGNFSPTFMNLGISFAKQFTDHIYVGATIKVVHESIFDAGANGVAFDAGVQYRTNLGEDSVHTDRLKLGISLRNIGSTMQYGGDGLTFRTNRADDFTSLSARPTESFEMPSVLSMGLSYDFFLGAQHRLTPLFAFIANSFSHDQLGVGMEYGFSKYLMLRYSFLYEKDILDDDKRMTAWTGHGMGLTVEIPFKSGEGRTSTFGLDYSYRSTNPFSGTHVIGARIDL
ncbi:MAG TPA: PorV/PorQ family protein [Bacteroidetes bacterium]|nr:PorV/PorQ family protein [Bacteroidota bacterium]